MKLPVGPVSRKDNGTYRCMAYGPQGEVSRDVHLLVLGTYLYYCRYCNVTFKWVVSSFILGLSHVLVLSQRLVILNKVVCDSFLSLQEAAVIVLYEC